MMNLQNKIKLVLVMGLLASIISCTSKADKQYGPLKTVEKVDIQKFMGRWYVIANIPTIVETDAYNAIETYTWNEEKNRIDIDYRHNEDSFEGKVKSYPQKGWIHDENSKAHWKVQPFWPLKFSYLIIDLDEKYSYTVISVPNRNYLWIMARTPQMDKALLDSLLDKARNVWGFDMEKLRMTPQKQQ